MTQKYEAIHAVHVVVIHSGRLGQAVQLLDRKQLLPSGKISLPTHEKEVDIFMMVYTHISHV